MQVASIDLIWIVVKDLKQAVKFYTETAGLKLMELHENFGWAELQGHQGGARLGIAEANNSEGMKAGQNAYVTLTVEDIEQAKESLAKKGAKLLGAIEEVPGHVKLQKGVDADGNHFQLVQKLF